MPTNIVRMALRTAVVALAGAILASTSCAHAVTPHRAVTSVPRLTAPPKVTVKPAPAATCSIPAPTTPDGYTTMFDSVDSNVWGAGDTALTVAMPGRSVWLYSDTASGGAGPTSATRFVHSTAITQTRGCLHVSNGGGQLLPNDAGGGFYWVDSAAKADATHIRVNAFQLDASGVATGRFRTASTVLTPAGDLIFVGWLGYISQPPLPPLVKDDGFMGNSVSVRATGQVVIYEVFPEPTPEYSYSPQIHPELVVDGQFKLLSLAVGWNSGNPLWQDTRPIYRDF